VTITGANLTGTSNVQFNGVPAASFAEDSDVQIRATVPSGATTGKISVTTSGGTAVSAEDFTVTTGGGATLSFQPLHDAYVRSSSAGTNYGSAATLRARMGSSETVNSYLKFEVAGLGGAVQSAKLRMYVTDASNDGGAVYAVSNNYLNTTTPWTQGGINWNNAPAISGAALSAAGAVSLDAWVELDVTPAITGNGIISFGLKSNASDVVYYSSKEGENVPELVIQTGSSTLASGAPIEGAAVPEAFALHQNYPNPFNPETRIEYDLAEAAEVRLTIYDVLGREVATLVEGRLLPGRHDARWDGRNHRGVRVSAGMYFYSLRANHFKMVRKMTLLQ
jgi:hypothetical protein